MLKKERNLRLPIMVTHEELTTIRERMKEIVTQNQSAFIYKFTLDGYALNVDFASIKKKLSLQRRSVNKPYSMFLEHLAKLVVL